MVNFTLCLSHHNLILKLHILNMYSLLLQLNKVVLKFFNYSLKTKKFPDSSVGKESACNAGDPGSIPGSGRSLEKGESTHSSVLAWRISRTIQTMGSQRVRHN